MTRIPGTHPRVRLLTLSWGVFVNGRSAGSVVLATDGRFTAYSSVADVERANCRTRAAAVRWLVAQYDATLPTAAALGGSIPDLTGEQTTTEYIAAIRG